MWLQLYIRIPLLVAQYIRILANDLVPNIISCFSLLPVNGKKTIFIKPLKELMNILSLLVLSTLFDQDQVFHVSLQTCTIFLQQI